MSTVPWANEEELFWLCCNQCTLDGQRQYQKHHIDGNDTNENPDNWTVLCGNCHSEAQKDLQIKKSMVRLYSEERLRGQRRIAIQSCLSNRYGLAQVTREQQEIGERQGFLELYGGRKTLLEKTILWLNGR